MSRFLYQQCQISKTIYPRWARKWINVRKVYANYYQCRRGKLEVMLENLGMHFEGSLHCGLHDSRNIARIAIRLMQDGCALKTNEYLTVRHDIQKRHTEVEVEIHDHESSDDDVDVDEKDSSISHDQSLDQSLDDSMKKLQIDSKERFADKADAESNCKDLLEYYRLQSS